jgi:hypothetical protein
MSGRCGIQAFLGQSDRGDSAGLQLLISNGRVRTISAFSCLGLSLQGQTMPRRSPTRLTRNRSPPKWIPRFPAVFWRPQDCSRPAPCTAIIRSIDISGDGPNNSGRAVTPVRDALIARGITINGLAISLPPHDGSVRLNSFGESYIEKYYKGCVIGGPGAFVIAVSILPDFEKAIRRKFVFEISGLPPRLLPTALSTTLADLLG